MEFVSVDPPGADVAVIRRGPVGTAARGTLLFLHGLGDASSTFAQALEAAALGAFEIVLVDLLGHGASDKPEEFDYRPASHAAVLFMAARKLKPEAPLHLVGFSLGGAVAVELARFPLAGLESLVLAEPVLTPSQMLFAKLVADHGEADFVRKFPALLASYAGPDSSEADRRWAETAAFCSAKAFYRSARGLLEAAGRGELMAHFSAIAHRRALVVSPQTYSDWPEAKQAEGAGARVFIVESPSKMPMYDSPDAFFKAVAKAVE